VHCPSSSHLRPAAGRSRIIKRAAASNEPVVITQRGRASAVLVSAEATSAPSTRTRSFGFWRRVMRRFAAGLVVDAEDVMAQARALLAAE